MRQVIVLGAVFVTALTFAATPSASTGSTEANSLRDEAPAIRPEASEASNSAANESATSATNSSTATVSAPAPSKFWGNMELRPSYNLLPDNFDTQNTTEFGYKPTQDTLVAYTQYWNTNLSVPGNKGLGLIAKDGFFRYKIKNVLQSDDKTVSFSVEPRLYLNTDPDLRARGLNYYSRLYLTVSKKLSDTVTLSFIDIPFYYSYNTDGYVSSSGPHANPEWENREYIVLDWSLFNGFVDLSLPILINHQHTRKFSLGGTNNNRWVHTVWTWPEIDFNVAPHTVLGAAWCSDNFIKDDFSGFDFANAWKLSMFQLVMRASL
jgi:hypothetical protein